MADKWSMQLTIWKGKMGSSFDSHAHATVHEISAEKLRTLIRLLTPEVFEQPRDGHGQFTSVIDLVTDGVTDSPDLSNPQKGDPHA